MTQSRAVQQIPLNPPASRPDWASVSVKLSSILECVCVYWFVCVIQCMFRCRLANSGKENVENILTHRTVMETGDVSTRPEKIDLSIKDIRSK